MRETLLHGSACVRKVWQNQDWPGGGSDFSFQFLDQLSDRLVHKPVALFVALAVPPVQGIWDLRNLVVRIELRHQGHMTLGILDQVSQSGEAPLLKTQHHVTANNVVSAYNSPSSRLERNSLFLKYLLNLRHVMAVYVHRGTPSSTGDLIPRQKTDPHVTEYRHCCRAHHHVSLTHK